MDCSRCQEHLVSYHLGELDEQTAREVEAELAACADCALALQRVRQTLEAVAQLPEVEPPASIRHNVLRASRLAVDNTTKTPWWQSQGFALAASLLLVAGAGWLSVRIATGPQQAPSESMEALAVADEAPAQVEPLPRPLEEAVIGANRAREPEPEAAAPTEQPAAEPAAPRGDGSSADRSAAVSSNARSREAAGSPGGGRAEPTTNTAAPRPSARQQAQGLDGLATVSPTERAEPPAAPALAAPSRDSESVAEEARSIGAASSGAPPPGFGERDDLIGGEQAARSGVASPTTIEDGRALGNIGVGASGGSATTSGSIAELLDDTEASTGIDALADEAPARMPADELPAQQATAASAPEETVTVLEGFGAQDRDERRRSRPGSTRSANTEEADVPPSPAPVAAAPMVEAERAPAEAESPPSLVESLFVAAVADFDAGRSRDAERGFTQFLQESSPSDARRGDATYLLGVSQLQRGDTAGGERTLRQFLDRYPGHSRTSDAEALLRTLAEEDADTLRRAPSGPASLDPPR